MDIALLELGWLSEQKHPCWGGHLKRGEHPHAGLVKYVEDGLIEAIGQEGYVITERGRELVRSSHRHATRYCKLCGQPIRGH